MVKRPRRAPQPRSPDAPVMQIRRTRTPDNPPTDLAPGQLGVEMANDPPRLWVGVPADINPLARLELLAYGGQAAGGWKGEVIGWDLKRISGSELRLVRHRGGHIKINGKLHLIPAEGVPITNLLGGSPLVQDVTFLVFLTVTESGEWRHLISGAILHRPSPTPGNDGVEILAALPGHWPAGEYDDNYTLVGIIRTGTHAELMQNITFIDEPRRRFVRPWLNRRSAWLRGNFIAAQTTNQTFGQSNTAFSELSGFFPGAGTPSARAGRLEWVQWADEVLTVNFLTQMATNGASQAAAHILGVGLDSITAIVSPQNFQYNTWAGYRHMTGGRTVITPSEGYHFLAPLFMSWSDFMVVYPISQQNEARFRLEAMLEGGLR